MAAICIFLTGFLALVYTYLLYPFLMRLLASRVSPAPTQAPEEWPEVTVLMSVYNEDLVLEDKLRSLVSIDYPSQKWRCLIGSDASTDQTNLMLRDFAAKYDHAEVFEFTERRGKPCVINELAQVALQRYGQGPNHIFLLTDANVLLLPDTMRQLMRHFTQKEIAVVDANMQPGGLRSSGISRSEQQYISREVQLKHHEGLVWGTMVGPFGGCYALRASYWTPVPPTFLVDDFYITMRALQKGGKAINDLDAVCTETVTHDVWVEFRRKSRISAGNFQNLAVFASVLLPPWRPLAFVFLSHKVLRWFGPFFLLSMIVGSFLLSLSTDWGAVVFWSLTGSIIAFPFIDKGLQRLGLHWLPLRSVSYFLLMNAALLHGFFKYLKGIKSNVWERTKRSQSD